MADPVFEFDTYVEDPNVERELLLAEADRIYYGILENLASQDKPNQIPRRSMKSTHRKTGPKRIPDEYLQMKRNALYLDCRESNVDPFDLMANTEFKKLALKDIMKHQSIRGANSFDEAKDGAIGHVYLDCYKRSDHYQNEH